MCNEKERASLKPLNDVSSKVGQIISMHEQVSDPIKKPATNLGEIYPARLIAFLNSLPQESRSELKAVQAEHEVNYNLLKFGVAFDRLQSQLALFNMDDCDKINSLPEFPSDLIRGLYQYFREFYEMALLIKSSYGDLLIIDQVGKEGYEVISAALAINNSLYDINGCVVPPNHWRNIQESLELIEWPAARGSRSFILGGVVANL